MLQKPAHKLKNWKLHNLFSAVTGVFPLECDLAVVSRNDSVVADRDAMNIAPEVVDESFDFRRGRFGKNHPGLFQKLIRKLNVWQNLPGYLKKYAAKDFGQGFDRNQKSFAGVPPEKAIDTTGRNNAMDMRMVFHGCSPGVQHRGYSGLAADEFAVCCQLQQ